MGGGGGLGGEARSRGLELGELGGSFFCGRVWLGFGRNPSHTLVCLRPSVLAWSHESATMYQRVADMGDGGVMAACFKEGDGWLACY